QPRRRFQRLEPARPPHEADARQSLVPHGRTQARPPPLRLPGGRRAHPRSARTGNHSQRQGRARLPRAGELKSRLGKSPAPPPGPPPASSLNNGSPCHLRELPPGLEWSALAKPALLPRKPEQVRKKHNETNLGLL